MFFFLIITHSTNQNNRLIECNRLFSAIFEGLNAHFLFYIKVSIFSKQSFTISFGTFPFTRRLRAFQSKLFTWSVKITPWKAKPSGSFTSYTLALTELVIGHIIAKPVTRLNSFGDKTIPGRYPPCSCPALGLKLTKTRWPRSGAAIWLFHSLLS